MLFPTLLQAVLTRNAIEHALQNIHQHFAPPLNCPLIVCNNRIQPSFVSVPPDIISLQLCTPNAVAV
jgi:hypothetical protein